MMHHRERSVSGPQHPLSILACLVGTMAKVLGKATTGMVSEHLVQDFGGLGMASSVKSNFARDQCCRPWKLTAFRFKVSSCANYKFEHLTTDFPDLGISSSDILVCHDLVCQSLSVRGFPHRAHAVRFNLFLLLRGLIQPVRYEKCWGENSGVLSGKTRQRHELRWVVLFQICFHTYSFLLKSIFPIHPLFKYKSLLSLWRPFFSNPMRRPHPFSPSGIPNASAEAFSLCICSYRILKMFDGNEQVGNAKTMSVANRL